jgi:hypothetical protein
VPSTREIIQAALTQNLADEGRKPVHLKLEPALSPGELDAFICSLPSPPSNDIRDLLSFCSGISGALEQIDFTGRTLDSAFRQEEIFPQALPIAHDGSGNYWVADLSGNADWGPIYFCCHDAPVVLVQAATLQQFVGEMVRAFIPPHRSLIDDVHEDRLFDVWRKNPGVIRHAEALASTDAAIRDFASGLDDRFELIDLRNAPVGMGFSWARYGARTELKRFGSQPIFAYRKPEKKGLLAKLLRQNGR